jgi:hypothetical protein
MTDSLRFRIARLSALVEFSFRSLGQAYGRTFLCQVALRHPIRLLRAVWHYWVALGAQRPAERALLVHDEPKFVDLAAGAGERFLVATGFCQKPFSCPAGRFNHNCRYLSRLTSEAGIAFPPVCAECPIGVLGSAAFTAGASFAILTSAADIARDILRPALEGRRFTHALFAICPYSVEPISLALLSSGIEGYVVWYEVGSCADYSQWLRADGGDKPERTALSPQVMNRMLRLLSEVAAVRDANGSHAARGYVQIENVYRPSPDCSAGRTKDQVPRPCREP